jgi:hypothetical protein
MPSLNERKHFSKVTMKIVRIASLLRESQMKRLSVILFLLIFYTFQEEFIKKICTIKNFFVGQPHHPLKIFPSREYFS